MNINRQQKPPANTNNKHFWWFSSPLSLSTVMKSLGLELEINIYYWETNQAVIITTQLNLTASPALVFFFQSSQILLRLEITQSCWNWLFGKIFNKFTNLNVRTNLFLVWKLTFVVYKRNGIFSSKYWILNNEFGAAKTQP